MSMILSFTVPIYIFRYTLISGLNDLCIPTNLSSYKNYSNWIHFGFGHPYVWLSSFLLIMFFFVRRTTVSYSTLIPMNRLIFLISSISCLNLLSATLFDDVIGIGDRRALYFSLDVSSMNFYLMNLRDFLSVIHKTIIGLVFFLFRPEIRLWLCESMQRFQVQNKKPIKAQALDTHNVLDDAYHEPDDDEPIQFRTDS
jgi:hypothetical protein